MQKPHSKTFNLRESAKILRFNGGQIKFANWLRQEKYLMAHLEPYQRYVNGGYFIYTKKIIKATGIPVRSPRLTVKGLYYIQKKLK